MTVYEFGDVVLIDFPQSGSDQPKRRPALGIIGSQGAGVFLERGAPGGEHGGRPVFPGAGS